MLNGTVSTMVYTGTAASSDGPALGAPGVTNSGVYNEGSVLVMQYLHYDQTTIKQTGLLHIKDLDVVLGELGADSKGNVIYQLIKAGNSGKRDGKVTFDLYWPK